MSCFDLEWFHLEKGEYLKEIRTLKVSNDFLNVQVARLADDEKILSNEIQNVMAVKLSADQRISDLEVKVAALGNELLMLIENGKLLPNQLEEANTRLRYLQDVHNAMDLREKDILANIKVLEDQLYTLRSNFEVTCQAAENDKSELDNIGASEVVYGQVEASGRDLPTLESSGEIQDYDAAPDVARQQIESTDIRAPNVCANTQVYSCMDMVLKSVGMEQHEKEMVSSSQLMEDIKKLQDSFNESEQRAQTLRKREAELKMKLQELMNKKSKSVSLSITLIISGGTIFMAGLLVLLWRTRSNPN
ncbi:hypothetical protein KP509_27G057300 [Ceratopteris richardii]|uniref:Uncharacterized protein n=1 Tax=Ceratopteris richardii TaxID=49495 RepID=A0A8T2RIF4_CERRI|nr:hypothetical protein KP509_27G057300 [Ceratopteris richardii]